MVKMILNYHYLRRSPTFKQNAAVWPTFPEDSKKKKKDRPAKRNVSLQWLAA